MLAEVIQEQVFQQSILQMRADELKNPMYATGIGLIMIGYEDRLRQNKISKVKNIEAEPVAVADGEPIGGLPIKRKDGSGSFLNKWFNTLKEGLLEEDDNL